jgi:hypothetical protein
MKKVICIILFAVFIPTLFAQELPREKGNEYEKGYLEGKASASENYSGGGWFAFGLGGGLVLGLIGMGIVAGISQSGTVEPPMIHRISVSGKSDEFKMGFYDGYSKKAKSKRLSNSLIGGAIGTVVIVVILTSGDSD